MTLGTSNEDYFFSFREGMKMNKWVDTIHMKNITMQN